MTHFVFDPAITEIIFYLTAADDKKSSIKLQIII
jgi:hypothetical protein